MVLLGDARRTVGAGLTIEDDLPELPEWPLADGITHDHWLA